jgi:hypothetical protein
VPVTAIDPSTIISPRVYEQFGLVDQRETEGSLEFCSAGFIPSSSGRTYDRAECLDHGTEVPSVSVIEIDDRWVLEDGFDVEEDAMSTTEQPWRSETP